MSKYQELVERIGQTEARIIRKVATKAVHELHWLVSVNDGEEDDVSRAQDLDTIYGGVGHTEETYFYLFDRQEKRLGFVWFVHGNDEDVVSDHSDNEAINALMEGVY